MSILIVDDEPELLEIVVDAVVAEKLYPRECVFAAADGEQALRMYEEKLPEIVISDMMLPKMGGAELIRSIRDLKTQTEVIVITGNSDLDVAVPLFKLGVTEFVRKPFGLRDIANVVRRVKQKIELRRENEDYRTRLIQAQRLSAVGLLAAGVAHEINNPNTYVKGNLELLVRYYEMIQPVIEELAKNPSEKQDSYKLILKNMKPTLEAALAGSERIRQIVSGLLSMSRSNGKERSLIDIKRVIEEAVTLCEHRLKKFELVTEIGSKPCEAFGSAQDVLQVVSNLLVNAADALEERYADGKGGKIKITLREDSNAGLQLIEVQDNAAGMSEATMKRVFDPFFTTKPPGKGTGLGLSISKGNLMEMGGDLLCESKLGEGSKFTVQLARGKKGPREALP